MALRRTKNSSGLLDLDNGLGGGYILSKICLSMALAVFGSNMGLAQVTPTIVSAPTASAITYGQALSSSTISGGVVTAVNPVVSTLAGSGSGYLDGDGTAARFFNPQGVAVDSAGNVYVADRANHRIRKVTPAGLVSTLAGSGSPAFADGSGTAASFSNPSGIAVDSSGNVYVADNNNHRIRKVTPAGVVSTLAGNGTAGFADGSGTAAQFSTPNGVAVDSSGNVYVADRGNNRIRKVTSAGAVTTLAGNNTSIPTDGTGTAASFGLPQGVALDFSGNVYVAEASNYIRKVTPEGVVTTLAGSGAGFADGSSTAAKFSNPNSVAVDSSGYVYVADRSNNRIRKVTPAGLVTTLAGSGAGFADGIGTAAQFSSPYGVAVDLSGNVYVADQSNHRIRKVTLSISGAWAFATPSTVPNAGVSTQSVVFTPSDRANYSTATTSVSVTVVLNPSGDEDGDGLTNAQELTLVTNPYQKDSDNDGVNDLVEVADNTNPNDASFYNSLSKGLVAYYPFSGNANDSSGNGNSGTPVSPVLSVDRLGAANAAYTFNGTSDRIDLANSAALNMNNGVPFSMSAWIKTDFNDGQRVILGKAAGASGNTPALFVDNEGKLRFDNFFINEVHSSTTVRTGTWIHVAVTYDGSTYRLYVNGLADGEKSFTGSNESGNSWTFSIGGSLNTSFPSGMFKGSIDEVQFWSRTLSPTEVAGVVQASSAPANRAPVIAGQSTTYDALAEFVAGPTLQSANSRWQYLGGNLSSLTLLGNWKTAGNEVIENQPQWDGNSGYLNNYPFVQQINSTTGPVPVGSLVIHPSNMEEANRAVAIGWKNTSGQTVAVNFHVNLRLPYGSNDGIDYKLQRGLAGSSRYLSIRSGSLGNSGSVALASDALLEMRPGEMLYLIVDSKNNFYADHTEVSAFTVTVVEAVNLDSISEGVASANNSGTAVTVLTSTSSDADSAALKGIAVTGVDATHGSWEYTKDGGNIWNSLSGVSLGSARLLKSDELHRVRFVPNANFSGNAEIRYRSWDQTSGEDGALADLTVAGGGAWVLVAYGAQASLGGSLTAPSGSFSSSVRSGSAVLPGALEILKNSSELAMTWTASGGSFPSGGIGSYTHGIAFALPNAAGMSFDGSASTPVIYYNGNSYNPLDSSFAVGSSSPDQSLVNVRTLVGSPGMPSQMYIRNKTFGAGYGGVYGLVMNDGSNAQLDYGQVPDSQTFKAVYLDHGTGAAQGQGLVMGGAGGAQNSYVPSTMALWARLDSLQVLALSGNSPVTASGNYLLEATGTTYIDVIDFDSSGAFSANTAIGTISVSPLEPTPINPFLGLNKLYTQNSTNGPTVGVIQGTNRYTYEGIEYAEASALARIRNIDVMSPGSNSFTFAYLGRTNEVAPGLVGYSGSSNPPVFSTYEEATNRYVDGTYLFEGRDIGDSIVTNAPVVWANSVTAFPNQVPEIQGQWAAGSLRLADPSGTNTISWGAWTNTSTNSLIRVEIKPSGDISYSPSAQTTLTTVLPADSTNCAVTGLTSNSYYQAQISFIGFQSGTVHSTSTQFRIVTGPQNPPSNPQVLGASPLGVLYVASGGDVVGTLASVTDEDSGDVVSVELPSYIAGVSNDNGMFLLEGNQLKLRTSEYYSGFGANNQTSYSIVLRARDSFGLYTDTAYTVVVNKVTPTILTPPTSTVIVYGQTLSSSGLNGGEASVQGAFTWTSPSTAPTVGISSQSITFTPTDSANYETVTTLVSVTAIDPDLPIANVDSFTAKLAAGMTTKVTTASLISNDKYSGIPAETRGVTFQGAATTSTKDATIEVKAGWLIYRPSASAQNGTTDTFTYTVSNGIKTATGTVTVSLVTPEYVAEVAIDRVSGDKVYFSVMPGMTFEVEGTSELGTELTPATWMKINGPNNGYWTSGADGRLIVTDPAAGDSRFYRFKWIP